jgi:hypothetical protein
MSGSVRSPGLLILFSILTCGIYLIYWYFQTYGDLQRNGQPPTGHSAGIDFLLVIITLGIYGIFVDYRISKSLVELQRAAMLPINDTATVVIVLDVFGLGVIGSAVHQSELNRVWAAGRPRAGG